MVKQLIHILTKSILLIAHLVAGAKGSILSGLMGVGWEYCPYLCLARCHKVLLVLAERPQVGLTTDTMAMPTLCCPEVTMRAGEQ